MNEPLHVAPRPCNTCPYLRSTPPGIWDEVEYEKLPLFDDTMPVEDQCLATFHCHQENATGVPTVCRGWLGVHIDGLAVRLAVVGGRLDPDVCMAIPDNDPTLYATGGEAYLAGIAGIENPSEKARRRIALLMRKGAAR